MSNCMRCTFPRKEPKGTRACIRCGRLEGTNKQVELNKMEIRHENLGDSLIDDPHWTLADFMDGPEQVGDGHVLKSEITRFNMLPEHSRMGGSSAKRFLSCPGSVRLIASLPEMDDNEEWTKEGTEAHALAARCLTDDRDAWELIVEYPLIDPSEAGKLQTYLDYVRSRPGRRQFEVKRHRPELHELMYGSIDAELVPVAGASDVVLEIVDFKWGVGVYVPVENNEQLMYYAALTIYDDPTFFPDTGKVRLTIAQPRVPWSSEPTRSWDTTVEEIKKWVTWTLLPAMREAEKADAPFKVGEHCQFCPAKLYCPEQKAALVEFEQMDLTTFADRLPALPNDELGQLYEKVEVVRMLCKAIEGETFKRLMDRQEVPGAQLEHMRTDRIWKEGVEAAAMEKFGSMAWDQPKILSPARMEKLPGADGFVAEWAYKPEGGFKVGHVGRGKPGVQKPTATEVWANVAVEQSK